MVPQFFVAGHTVSGVQAGDPQVLAVAPPPQVWPGPQTPQFGVTPPQPLPWTPQVFG